MSNVWGAVVPVKDLFLALKDYAFVHPVFSGTIGLVFLTTLLWLCLRRPRKRGEWLRAVLFVRWSKRHARHVVTRTRRSFTCTPVLYTLWA